MNATIITPDLAIGSYTAIEDMKKDGWLSLCLTDDGKDTPYDCIIPMIDGGGNQTDKIEQAIGWVLSTWNAKQKAYVCCIHGMNRSVSISAAALTLANKCEWFSQALIGISQHRQVASPRDDTMAEVLMVVNRYKRLQVNI